MEQHAFHGNPIGLFHTWWRGDLLPNIGSGPALTIEPLDLEAGIPLIDIIEARARADDGHQGYVARHDGEPVAYGWSATIHASIGELGINLTMPPGNRYLWDFVTLPEWRGHRIYPRMLQSIVQHDSEAIRFWVGHDLENVASKRGIARAGFQCIGALYRLPDSAFVLAPHEESKSDHVPIERVEAAASLLHVPTAGFGETGGE